MTTAEGVYLTVRNPRARFAIPQHITLAVIRVELCLISWRTPLHGLLKEMRMGRSHVLWTDQKCYNVDHVDCSVESL